MALPDGITPDLPDDRPTYPLEHLLELPGGRRAEWEAIGEGPPLLWIEGGPGLPAHLARPEAQLLADRFRCYLVNAPGCGRSTPPSSPDGYGLDDHVRYFDDVRHALGLGAVTLMGHSFGGLVAIALTLAVPEAVERLIIISGYAGDASVPEDVAAAEREVAFDRLRDQPWFAQAVATFDDDSNLTSRELDEQFEACWPLYFADPESPSSKEHIARLRRETRWNIDADAHDFGSKSLGVPDRVECHPGDPGPIVEERQQDVLRADHILAILLGDLQRAVKGAPHPRS